MKKKQLRSGYTTGACAAAAAKAAVLLLDESCKESNVGANRCSPRRNVDIPFPDGSRHTFKIQHSTLQTKGQEHIASASVIKYAGDDPDVTNGAEITAEARVTRVGARRAVPLRFTIHGGKGVGTVTKPGLPVPVGEPAINPVPRKMIEEAVMEAVGARSPRSYIEITISVPNGEELAKKTLNHRLGIVGGISILGTTGIVKPVSTEAWTATIASSMDVAKAVGLKLIVLSAGRTSERAHMKKNGLPEESYVLMGDHLEYSVQEAGRHGFERIHLCAQWAKMVKIAMATPQTHVKFGAINIRKAVRFLNSLGADIPDDKEFNTAREIFDFITVGAIHELPLQRVCNAARLYAESISGEIPVRTYLVSYNREIIASNE